MLNCIVVDDEQINRLLLEEFVAQIPFLKLAATCKNAFEAMQVLEKKEIDLVFLDIQMPGMLGIDFIKVLPKKPMTILVTAYSEYALEGYDLDIIDYLMKPLSIERFTKSAFRALAFKETNNLLPQNIFINVDYGLVKIRIAEITYIEGLKDYVKIFIEGTKKAILTKTSMKNIIEKLPSKSFMRIHRSFIVNLDKIDKIKGNKLYIGLIEIPISENSIDELLKNV